ncbi:MAG: processing protein [Nocardioidaceae bacterium]|jgi:DNA processing protein|nr:processing protein [Nocardioidaceae bacterium]
MTRELEDRLARVALGRLVEPGDPRLAGVVAELGAVEVYAHLREDRDVTGVRTDVAARLAGLDPEGELERAERQGLRFVCPGDPEWPAPVADLERAGTLNGRGGVPLGLWLRGAGSLDDLCRRSVSVVGSRSATTYGVGVAGEIAAHLAGERVTVVSGAAFGIDQAAHRGALAGRGPTVAVLACGVDRAYPLAHRDLLAYIAETGLVVSELPPGCAPTKHRFLARNRVIAALSQGTVVVEAAVRSGALNTSSWAALLNRAVMGVPGPVTSAPSEGVHELIRGTGATLVTRGSDVLELVSPVGSHTQAPLRAPQRPRDRLSVSEQQVLDAVPVSAAAPTSSVARAAGLGAPAVGKALRRLRTAGFVEGGEDGWRLRPRDEAGTVS